MSDDDSWLEINWAGWVLKGWKAFMAWLLIYLINGFLWMLIGAALLGGGK